MDYLCNQEKDIEILNLVRNMTDEEFEKYIEELKAKEKTEEYDEYEEIPLPRLFTEEMTSNEARTIFFNAIEGKTKEEVERIKTLYFEIIPKITEKEMQLAKEGWLF